MTQDWPIQIPRLPLLADLDGIVFEDDYSEWVSKIPNEVLASNFRGCNLRWRVLVSWWCSKRIIIR